MPARHPLEPEAVAKRLRVHYRNRRRDWLASGGSWPLAIALHPPTEREAARDLEAARAWIAVWQSWQGSGELVCASLVPKLRLGTWLPKLQLRVSEGGQSR